MNMNIDSPRPSNYRAVLHFTPKQFFFDQCYRSAMGPIIIDPTFHKSSDQ